MTDFMFLPVWFALSWLIRQVEGGELDEEDSEAGSGGGGQPAEVMEAEPFEPIEQAIKMAIAAFSLLLLGLSISAYKKTALKKILYAAVAFGLFAVQMFYEYLEEAVEAFDTPYGDIIFTGITLGILVLFFMAIVRKK